MNNNIPTVIILFIVKFLYKNEYVIHEGCKTKETLYLVYQGELSQYKQFKIENKNTGRCDHQTKHIANKCINII